MTDPQVWTVGLASSAIRDLDKLPPRVLVAVIEFLHGPMASRPFVRGKPLRGAFAGEWSARRGSYRVLFRPDAEHHQLVVTRVSHRSGAYRPR